MAERIVITDGLSIEAEELDFSFVRSSGPGGQNVNKVSSAAQLRFDIRHSPSLPDEVRQRAERLAGSRLTQDGSIVIVAQRFRAQPMNREDAVARLVTLLRQAATPPKRRRATRPTLGSKLRRLDSKGRDSATKRLRSSKPPTD